MGSSIAQIVKAHAPMFDRVSRLPRQLTGRSPFGGSIRPSRVPLFIGGDRPSLPFPHPWNYKTPLRILESYFVGAQDRCHGGADNRFLDVPGFAPVLVTRDAGVIRAISTATGAKEGQFDRDTMPSRGIARATGEDSLLYANGPCWKAQKQLSASPFSRTSLFQPEQFEAFEETFRRTAVDRLSVLLDRIQREGEPVRVSLEPEIQAVMLEMLVVNFFGAEVDYGEIRERYVPALERVIGHIVSDTVTNKLGVPLRFMPSVTGRIASAKQARAVFEELTDLALSGRRSCKGQWGEFKSDASDEALRSNVRVFLAGALEATTSYASWAISHLARDQSSQSRLFEEIREIERFKPEMLKEAPFFTSVLDETLRLTPALYFHPRSARAKTSIETKDGRTLEIPRGTHILLDVWHANRNESEWGLDVTGFAADSFAPQRWERIAELEESHRDFLHFGFGHGPRFCPGKHLGQLEVMLVVGAIVKLFRFNAAAELVEARAGVSTKPGDGVELDLWIR